MFCPKCKNDNLGKQAVCFYCGADLPKNTTMFASGPGPKKLVRKKQYIRKKKLRAHPKCVEIFLPENEGTVKVTFLKPPFIDNKKVRLQYRGVDGRFRRSTEICSPMIKDIIEAVNLIR